MCRTTAFIALLSTALTAHAQSPPRGSGDSHSETPHVTENPLSILYARDANGKFIPLLKGLRYEEINRYLKNRIARSNRAKPDRITLASMKIEGDLDTQITRMSVQFVIQVRQDVTDDNSEKNEWLRVPLALHEGSLESEPRFEGAGEFILQRDPVDGFVAWYRGSSVEPLTVTLDLVTPTSKLADSSEVNLTLPKATQSSFEATIRGQANGADVIGGRISDDRSDEGSLFVQCVGLEESFQISWQKRESGTAQATIPARLNVEADIEATFDQIGLISSNVKLKLSGSEAISTFDLRIPSNAEIVSLVRSNYEARMRAASPESAFRQYEITMATPATEQTIELPIELRVGTGDSGNAASSTNIAAIEVVDTQLQTTVRQIGRVRLVDRQGLRVDWEIGPDVSQINDPELETNDKLLAVFEYSRQPCFVNVSASSRTTRTSVTPFHFLSIEANRIYLRSVFRYKIRGGSVSELVVDLKGLEYDYASFPDGTRFTDEHDEDSSELRIELESPLSDSFELRVRSHRPVEPPGFSLNFPTPEVDAISPAIVLVGAADNVSLDFPEHRKRGFMQDAIPVDLLSELPAMTTTQPIRCFRMQTEQQANEFFVSSTVMEQRVHLNVASLVVLSRNSSHIRQRFAFDIQYERLERLRFQLPNEVYELIRNASLNNRVKTTINGDAFPTTEWIRSIDLLGNAVASIQLPVAAIGTLVVELEYELGGGARAIGPEDTVDVPLVTALLNRPGSVSNQVIVNPIGVRVNGFGTSSPWDPNDQIKAHFPIASRSEDTTENEIGLNAIGAISNGQPNQVRILATQDEGAVASANAQPTRLDRVWVHTTITTDRRRDQVAFLLQTEDQQISINIPNDPSPAGVRVWVNEEELMTGQVSINPEGDNLSIPLSRPDMPPSATNFLIEVQLEFNERPRVGSIRTRIPSVSDLNDCNSWVWQLTLPPSEHLISSDNRLVLAQPWSWRGWFLSRNPNIQSVLESWSGANNLDSTPGGNHYVFRSLIPRETVTVRTADRRTLVTVASGTALAFGLMLIYLSEMRQPIVLFLAAITLATFGLLFPGPAVLMAQASVVGVVLALIGQWTALLIRRMSISRQLLQIPAQKRRDSSSRLQQSWSDGTSQAATASMPIPDNDVVVADPNG